MQEKRIFRFSNKEWRLAFYDAVIENAREKRRALERAEAPMSTRFTSETCNALGSMDVTDTQVAVRAIRNSGIAGEITERGIFVEDEGVAVEVVALVERVPASAYSGWHTSWAWDGPTMTFTSRAT